MVRRIVSLLQSELGGDLHAVWLYGSRARGQAPHPESDIDLMAIADGGSARYGMKAIELINQAASEQGQSPVWYSLQLHDPAWVRGRREIRSFFIQEVDRDKIVLYDERDARRRALPTSPADEPRRRAPPTSPPDEPLR